MKTLFLYPQFTIDAFKKIYNKTISAEFVNCADQQLTPLFERITGLKINKRLSISWASEWEFFYEESVISKLAFSIYVNHNWDPVTVLWKSKAGRVYKIEDTDIDCNDLEFWFEGIDVALIHRQMFPKVTLPFKLKDLSYELVITRINLDCTLELQLKKGQLEHAEAIIQKIDDFINDFNIKSEKKDRKYGVVHNWKSAVEDTTLIYDIDLGSVGPYFFKKLLPFFSELNCFLRVELC